jgi:sialate O-acetylesterase
MTQSELFELDSIFTDHMVLQRDKHVSVYGYGGHEGEKIEVSFNGQIKASVIQNGRWVAVLDPMPLNKTGQTLEVKSENKILQCNDVLIGDVWLLGGQSNMARPFRDYPALDSSVVNHPLIRIVNVAGQWMPVVEQPVERLRRVNDLPWVIYNTHDPSAMAAIENFSPLGSYFAKHAVEDQDVPVGLILAASGGTAIEPWVSHDIANTFTNKPVISDQENLKRLTTPAHFYNQMIYPLKNFKFKGVLWYQGESNHLDPENYNEKFRKLIRSWRELFRMGDIPFVYVQISSYDPTNWGESDGHGLKKHRNGWIRIREEQAKALAEPNTGMVTTYDIGDREDIHPVGKITAGYRLYHKTKQVAYNHPEWITSGPVYDRVQFVQNQAIVRFNNVGGGLMQEKGDMLRGFTIAGDDQVFYEAQATIVGVTVEVSSAQVKEPIAVRYAWQSYTEANLYNKEGFPAEQFRTDDFVVRVE